ncbi:hypothetical protein BJY59DRAFT_336749 [Rhodotorula toruloides]
MLALLDAVDFPCRCRRGPPHSADHLSFPSTAHFVPLDSACLAQDLLRTSLAMDTQQSSPLLRLPVELLYAIFTDVYASRLLKGRLCRALLHLQDDLSKRKYRRVKLVGSQKLLQYAQTIETRYMLGRACESMTITSDEQRPHDKLTDVDLEAFFANLPNLRRFVCDSTQLCVAFTSLLKSPGRTPFPQLEELDLSPPKSLSFPVNSLLKLSSLTDLEIVNYRPEIEASVDVEDEEPILLPRLA